ncbi:MAG: ABC transporter substrate-binding protein [Lachnospiraceae bacterium]|nr:ABC transporter substrate-binding protein [Lachnospiraceae bacterium]
MKQHKTKPFRQTVPALLALLILAGALAGCTPQQPKTGWKSSVTIGTDAAFRTMDPQQISNAAHDQVFRMVYDTLLAPDPETGRPGPGLADSWSWTDGSYTALRLHLREGVRFQSGDSFGPEDVVFTMDRITNSTVKSSYDRTEITGPSEVVIYLSGPNADFPWHLAACTTAIVSKKAVEKDPEAGASYGTGAWMFDRANTVPGDHVTLVRFEDCWKEKPVTETIVLRYFANESARLIALENGEIDCAITLSYNEYEIAQKNQDLEVNIFVGTGLNYLAFNTTAEPGDRELLRLAVAYAIDRSAIIRSVGDPAAVPAVSVFSRDASAYTEKFSEDLSYDPAAAREMIARLRLTSGTVPELKLLVNTTIQSYKTMAEVVQEQCRQAGITVTLEETDGSGLTARSKFTSPEHQVLLYTIFLNEYNSDISRLFSPGISSNKAVLTDERVISLLEDARRAGDAEADRLYKELQTLAHDSCWYIPLFYGSGCIAWRKGVEGVVLRSTGRYDFTYIRAPR